MVSTRRRAKKESAAIGDMMSIIQACGCVATVLKFLPLEDFYHFSLCNKKIHGLCKDDQRLRFMKTYTKSWWSWFDRVEDQEYADDYPFKKLRRGGLHDDFASRFARTEIHMVENIVAWCGGWEAFLEARNKGAKPAVLGTTAVIRAGDKNKVHDLCKPVVIFDIHRDNSWQWSAIHPLDNDDLRTLAGVTDDNENHGIFYPYATKGLGDPTISGTAFPWNHGRRPSRYLLSANSDDTRAYKFSVSIVSPNFAETFVESFTIIPQEILNDNGKNWYVGDRGVGWAPNDDKFCRNNKLHMCRPVFECGERRNFGKKANDTPVHDSPRLRFTYYKDTRNKQARLHVTMEIWFDTTHFYDMWVHPPAPDATKTMGNPQGKKRRL